MMQRLWKFMQKAKSSSNPCVRTSLKVYRWLHAESSIIIYYLCRLLPLKDKVIATTFRGRQYADNPKFIIEELMKISDGIDYVWLKNQNFDYNVPEKVRTINYYALWRKAYEYATAKVWINTHRMESYIRKRKGQVFLETWHGGLGIKKIEGDVPRVMNTAWEVKEIRNTAELADVFVSNSEHLSMIYRRAFGYNGRIWKVGYPKNDILFKDNKWACDKVKGYYGINSDKIAVYAPTFRDSFEKGGYIDMSIYDIDLQRMHYEIEGKFGGTWTVLARWHPIMRNMAASWGGDIVDATDYPDMQEIILAADIFISDYSSCIFDAAIRKIPCLVYATDFEMYKQERGVYFEMDELPFPYATNNDELVENIREFDIKKYQNEWEEFKDRTGLYETGHAGRNIAEAIKKFMEVGEFEFGDAKRDI